MTAHSAMASLVRDTAAPEQNKKFAVSERCPQGIPLVALGRDFQLPLTLERHICISESMKG
jgi:hypothetical protein